jgi:hypothetical protein
MAVGKLVRRLERLESELIPSDESVLTVNIICIGQPEQSETFELHRLPQERRPWGRLVGRPLRR